MPYVVSTHSSDVEYVNWSTNKDGGVNIRKEISDGKTGVLIHGGHGVAQKSGSRGIYTPDGVITKITDDELTFLKSDQTFLQHEKSGGVKVVKTNADPSKVAKDMATSKDTPLTVKDFEKGGRVSTIDKIKVNGGRELQ